MNIPPIWKTLGRPCFGVCGSAFSANLSARPAAGVAPRTLPGCLDPPCGSLTAPRRAQDVDADGNNVAGPFPLLMKTTYRFPFRRRRYFCDLKEISARPWGFLSCVFHRQVPGRRGGRRSVPISSFCQERDVSRGPVVVSADIGLFRHHLFPRFPFRVAGTRRLSWRRTPRVFGGLLLLFPLCFPSARLPVLPDHAVLITTASRQVFGLVYFLKFRWLF